MTTEDDFQAVLDAGPSDWQTRLVFADWLQDRGDPRAEGYRALAIYWRVPHTTDEKDQWWWYRYATDFRQNRATPSNGIPPDWFDLMPSQDSVFWPAAGTRNQSRRMCEEAAALAFLMLPAARQSELLSMEVPTSV